MALQRNKTLYQKLVAGLAIPLVMSACGGGGAAEPAGSTATPAAAPATTVATLVPGAAMSWATASEKSLSLTVQAADGRPAAAAAVRIFTLSRTSPQDGSALEEPVPMSLLDTVVTDAAGRARLTLQWPGHIDELLALATLEDTQGRAVLAEKGTDGVVLRLTR